MKSHDAKSGKPSELNQKLGNGVYKISSLRILSEITTNLSSDNDLEVLLERFLSTMIRLAGANAGAVRVLTSDGGHLRLVASIGLPEEVLERERIVDLGCGICGEAVRDNATRLTGDLHVCAQRASQKYFGHECKKVIAVPLQYKGKVHGIYNLFMAEDQEVPEEISLLFRSISEHLGMALENARLMRENLRITLMNERQLMANEVHDSLAQTLAYMKMRVVLLQDAMQREDDTLAFKYVNDVSSALETSYSSLRELLTHFRNRMDPNGLLHALQETVQTFHDRTGIQLDFINHAPQLNLTVDQEVQVFHIVQEALANIIKHSRAQRATLLLSMSDGRYVITIEDDGAGIIQTREDAKNMVHFGLNIMRERAQSLEGNIEIESLAGQGTRVRLDFPVTCGSREGTVR